MAGKLLKGIVTLLILLVVSLAVIGGFSDTSTQIPTGRDGKYVNINDMQIRVLQKGSGPDVLLIHGLPGSIEDWTPILDTLAQKYRVTVFDRPGHGYSELDTQRSNLNGNVKTAFALIEKLQLKDVIVVGHSYGGAIIAAMAEQNPSNIKGFVSIAGLVKDSHVIPPIFYAISTPLVGKGLAKLGNQFIGKNMMVQGVDRAFSPNLDAKPADFVASREDMWLTVKNSLATAHEEINLPADLPTINLEKIEHPYYILQGDSDASVKPTNADILHKAIKGSQLQVLENTGHFPQYSHPEIVINAIDNIAQRED